MNKIIVLVLFVINTLWANIEISDSSETLKELGLESSFINDSELISIYDDYSTQNKIKYYRNMFKQSSLNLQIVKSEIKKEDLPSSILFIPVIESSFVNQTRGKNSPAGLWQIIPSTASHLQLRNNEFVDERLDLIKSTDAASSYLKRYYKKFDKWYLAILAYNCGEGNVVEAITRASLDKYLEENPDKSSGVTRSYQRVIEDYRRTKKGMSSLYTLYSELESLEVPFDFEYLIKNNTQKQYLPQSSLSYIKKIVVFTILSNKGLFENAQRDCYELEKVKVPNGVSIKSIAQAINLNYRELEKINKHIKKGILPKDSKMYNFYIPKNKLELYNNQITTIKPIKENKKENKLELSNKKTATINKEKNKNKPIIYKVKKGDSFESIAKKYKIDVRKLKSDNKKKSNLIKIGDSIEIHK